MSPSVPAPSSSSSTSKDSRTQKKIAKPSQPQPSTLHKAAIKGLPPPPPPRVSQPTRNRYYDTFLTRVDKQVIALLYIVSLHAAMHECVVVRFAIIACTPCYNVFGDKYVSLGLHRLAIFVVCVVTKIYVDKLCMHNARACLLW